MESTQRVKEEVMFAKQVTKDVAVGEEIVTVRKLSGKTLQKARDARRVEQVQNMRDIGAEMIKAFREEREKVAQARPEALPIPAKEPTKEELEKARKDSFADYDRDTVLVAGVVRWTAKVPVNSENIADLDEESATLLHNEILDLSVQPVNTEELGKGV
jgi:hypothetical protein